MVVFHVSSGRTYAYVCSIAVQVSSCFTCRSCQQDTPPSRLPKGFGHYLHEAQLLQDYPTWEKVGSDVHDCEG